MLLEIAIGDAFGACYEWVEKHVYIMSEIELKYKMVEPSLIKPGNYTDDAQMTRLQLLQWDQLVCVKKLDMIFHNVL